MTGGFAPLKFGTSGWRGVIAREFTFANARRAVAAIARVLGDGRRGGLVLVGYDTRFAARDFAEEAARLLLAEGFAAEVSRRPVPTPVLSYEIVRRRAEGALNFTASHNPPEYLGLKLSTADGAPALPAVTSRVEEEIARIAAVPEPPARPVPEFDPAAPYLEDLSRRAGSGAVAGLRLALDFRFGTSAGFLDAHFDGQRARLSRLHERPDPLFGGLSPQCGERELAELGEAVRREGARLGLATDGDADRFGVLDEAGRYVSPNAILALLAWELASEDAGGLGIARSVATTHALDAVARRFGRPLYQTPVGFKYIGELLLAGKILFGGEESAGLTIAGHVPDKDGILAGALVARSVAVSGEPLTRRLARLEDEIGPYRSGRRDEALSPEGRTRVAALAKSPPGTFAGLAVETADRTDGLQIGLPDGRWVLWRESGTEPLVRIYAESADEAETRRLLAEAARILKE